MAKEFSQKRTDKQIRKIIESEGLDYAILHYLSPDDIESEDTRKLWNSAGLALKMLQQHLGVDDGLDELGEVIGE